MHPLNIRSSKAGKTKYRRFIGSISLESNVNRINIETGGNFQSAIIPIQ